MTFVQSSGRPIGATRVGCCLDLLDLFMAKAVANREKDRVFNRALIQYHYVMPAKAMAMVDLMPINDGEKRRLRTRVRRWTKTLRKQGHEIPED